jgi:hypothetical protein
MTYRHTSLHDVEIEWLYDFEPADPATGSGPAVSNAKAFLLKDGYVMFLMPQWWCEQNADPDSLIIAAQEASDDRRADYAAE